MYKYNELVDLSILGPGQPTESLIKMLPHASYQKRAKSPRSTFIDKIDSILCLARQNATALGYTRAARLTKSLKVCRS